MANSAKSLNEKKSGGQAAPAAHFLFQLAAALDNPSIKSLEAGQAGEVKRESCCKNGWKWHEDGKGILLHTRLYEDEIQQHQDLFPELGNLKPVSVLQAWLATCGFKARMTKTESDMLAFQHADFKKLSLWAGEADGQKAEAPLKPEVPKQPKKSKKRKSSVDISVTQIGNTGGTLSPESMCVEKKSQRLRPLYQYINYDNPEMNSCDLSHQDSPPTLRNKTAPLELKITPNTDDKSKEPKGPLSATSGTTMKTEVDKSTQVDINKMLSVCAAHLVPPLSPQHK